jgi:hypothetical protein
VSPSVSNVTLSLVHMQALVHSPEQCALIFFPESHVLTCLSGSKDRQESYRLGRNLQLPQQRAYLLRYRSLLLRSCAATRAHTHTVHAFHVFLQFFDTHDAGLQAAVVFDGRIAVLHKIWRDMPMECVKVRCDDGDVRHLP